MAADPPERHEATRLLRNWRAGDPGALSQLTPLVYGQLRHRARHHLHKERADHSLQATELVNEVFVRLIDADVSWQDRAHFLAVAASSMRRILVDHARARGRKKRGDGRPVVELDDENLAASHRGQPDAELLALDQALEELTRFDAAKGRIVELAFFGGLSVREIAEAVEASKSGVQRDLAFSKAWLFRRLKA